MKIQRFEVPGLAQSSYMLSSAGEAIVVDPMRDFERYLRYASERGLRIRYVTETHIHADYASGAAALAEAAGAELALSGYDEEPFRSGMPHRALHDGETLQAGSVRLVARHTPGHTPEHLSFLLFDEGRSKSQPMAIFSGDFLFVGSVGRPDLLGEDAKLRLAHELYRSLHERIADLPGSVQVYPGHGAGSLCGAGISERGESTLGYERANQPLFGLDEQAFVREILASVPPMPTYYPRMKALNSVGADAVATVPGATPISATQAAALIAAGDVTVLDVRRPESFGGAHIDGAINIGAGQNLALWAGWLLDAEQRILLVTDKGDDSGARRSLVRVGLDRIAGYLHGGMAGWLDAGLPFASLPQATTDAVQGRKATTKVLDVRSDNEWKRGHIDHAEHIPLGDVPQHLAELGRHLGREDELVVVCGSGYRSSVAASLLQRSGFTHVHSMAGGMGAWNQRRFPTTAA